MAIRIRIMSGEFNFKMITMKMRLKYFELIMLTGLLLLLACKKNNDFLVPPAPLPSKATINFHIKDASASDWGEPIFLYRLGLTATRNYYDSTQDIYLRPNIDTSFAYQVEGNTNNLFTVGGDPFNGVIIYMEQKFIPAGRIINWEIIY